MSVFQEDMHVIFVQLSLFQTCLFLDFFKTMFFFLLLLLFVFPFFFSLDEFDLSLEKKKWKKRKKKDKQCELEMHLRLCIVPVIWCNTQRQWTLCCHFQKTLGVQRKSREQRTMQVDYSFSGALFLVCVHAGLGGREEGRGGGGGG